MSPSFGPNFDGIFRVLSNHQVRFVVIGGVAAILQGSPYATRDIDICPDGKDDNLLRLASALKEMGAQEWDPHADTEKLREWTSDLLTEDDKWLLVTDFGRVDLLFVPLGTKGYGDLRRRQRVFEVGGIQVPVADIEDIIRMKESAARERDLVHLPTLRKLLDRRDPT
jgi:predicted nucleotidyltransferase